MNNYELIEKENGWKVIRTSCGCGLNEHILDIEIEKDKDFGLSLIFTYNLPLKDYILLTQGNPNSKLLSFIQVWWGKIKLIIKILFRREVSFEEGFLFRGREHAEEVADWIKKTAQETENEI